ncbi:MAG: hypothetical protein J0H54_13580, partial [Rhizobiales bacterium]|nr:hypothetical protein [Hyphomicrobiales bacterium]
LGFPNQLEKALGYEGAALMVHGACTSSGCFALTDSGVAEIYALARDAFAGGQTDFQVQSLPFRMTARNLATHRDDPNLAFWLNLKEGADQFDVTRQPPRVAACGRKYVFGATVRNQEATLEPLAPCPAYDVDPSVAAKVARKAALDQAGIAELVAQGPEIPIAYADGGMNWRFRDILKSSGPARLSKLTSDGVQVSRPEAALADPYGPGAAGVENTAGSAQR